MSTNSIISPISIDLGAKNTGVYFAHYEEGASLENIEKEGKVYQLEKDKYTLLMEKRTAARHQRRGYDRRQMVKRLFKLIWEKHFKLEWNKDVQQTISFLLNRRGFTFLTEEYHAKMLSQFPKKAYDLLPDELKIANENGEYDFASALIEWANEGEEKVREVYEAISKKPKCIAKRQFFIRRTEKLREYCEKRKKNEVIEEKPKAQIKLSQLSARIWDEWQQNGVDGLDENFVAKNGNDNSEIEWKSTYSYDLVTYLNEQAPDVACQILDSLPDTSNEKEILRKSIWNFTAVNFKIEGQDFIRPEPLPLNVNKKEKVDFEEAKFDWKKLHLQHLAYALHKTLNELESGARHRSKYFNEVEKVLDNENHTYSYLENFRGKLQPCGYQGLDKEKLARLIGHLSNLELKPLRKYFNDKEHQKSDYWNEVLLSDIFECWILKEWRVNLEKDKNKAPVESGDYKKLRKDWYEYKKTNPNTVVDFWLKTDPLLTIPPYQDNNNRRPPKCQSLILNPTFLDNKYPKWQTWLGELRLGELRKPETVEEYLDGFEDRLKSLKSGKKNSYFPDKKIKEPLNARVLQFIFDRAKDSDPLNLNKIYSYAKKWRQKQSTDQERQDAKSTLEKAIGCSYLPAALKTDRDYNDKGLLKEGTFLHLVCKYYKQRQRARDGRLFIHPEYRYVKNRGYENTGRFDDKNCLLTYCNHKPRQKKYQSFHDIAGVFQISPDQLQNIIGSQSDKDLVLWLKRFRGLPSLCTQSADAQKKHRGELKTLMDSVIREDRKRDSLYKLNTSLEKVAGKVGKALFVGDEGKILDQKIEKFRSPFSFAQINNIAFKDRSGNSNTCPACSTDNAHRMQMVETKAGKENHAKAQRLPAIPTRLIDGAVMRMARIVGGAIAKDKWKKINCELSAGKHVRVPIITESNRFEFEPSLKDIKGKPLEDADKKNRESGQEQLTTRKDKRIKEASLGKCPYTGKPLGVGGDKDHIIPRSSQFGTLNDEANLIWASVCGNREIKKDNVFSLANLNPAYKQKQFGTSNDKKIEEQIVNEIWDSENEEFTFGRYRSFINLTEEQQKAFRHALFLMEGHPVRDKVISAIDNRTRTLVNGTQRYFAEEIANNLYKEAKKIQKQHLLSFDYFGVEAQDNSRGDGVYNLREVLVKHYRKDLKVYDKKKGKTQNLYSHLIDAQVVFCMVADAHRNEGGLKLNLGNTGLWSRVDKETGEIKPKKNTIYDNKLFNSIQVDPKQQELTPLERQIPKPQERSVTHRPLFNENAVALHFLKLIEIKEPNQDTKYLKGFLALSELKNCLVTDNENQFDTYKKYAGELTDIDVKKYKHLYVDKFAYSNGRSTTLLTGFGEKHVTVKVYSLDKKKVCRFLVDHFNTASDVSLWDPANIKILKTLYELWYFTQRKKIIVKNSNKESLYLLKDNDKKCGGYLNPQIEKSWAELHSSIDHSEDLRKQLKDYFLNKWDNGKRVPKDDHDHKKVAKDFSLPVSSSSGYLVRKKNWKGEYVYYCRPLSNDFSQTVLHRNEDGVLPEKNPDERLANAYRRTNIFFGFKNFSQFQKILSPVDGEIAIDANLYYPAQTPEDFKDYFVKVENRRTDADRPRFKFYLSESDRMNFVEFKEFVRKYPFRNLQDLSAPLRKEWIEDKTSNLEDLLKNIKSVESMGKQPKKLLPTLKNMQKLFEESQENKTLDYSARAKFTLKQPQ